MVKKKILWMLLSFLLVASLVLASCAKEEVVEEEEEEEEEIELLGFPRGETVFIAQLSGRVGSPDNFNEWVGWKWRDRGMANLMNEPLWTIDYLVGEVINSLAAAPPEYSEDFTQLTIELREGVYWSDGVEFTADDVVFTIEMCKATPGMRYNVEFQAVERVYAADKYTVVFELAEPMSRFHLYFMDQWGGCCIMPKHVWEDVEDPLTFTYNPPLSLGPYVLHSYDPAGFWTAWERRDDWERTPVGMQYGQPGPKYVVYAAHVDDAAKVMALALNEVDTGFLPLEAMKAALGASPYVSTFRPDYPWMIGGLPWQCGIVFNTYRPPFDNKEVRWALTLATDIASYAATAYDCVAEMSPIHISNTKLYLENYHKPILGWLEDFTLDIGDGETFKPFDSEAAYRLAEYAEARGYPVPEDVKEFYGIGWWKYAPDIAAKLLEKNGFTQDADGKWLLPDGTPWEITLLTGVSTSSAQYRNVFAAMYEWRKFGIDATVKTSEMASDLATFGDFDVFGEWVSNEGLGGTIDLYINFYPWHSDFVRPLGERTFSRSGRWSDPRMDAVIDELKLTPFDATERMVELGLEGLKIAVEEMPAMSALAGPDFYVVNNYYWTNWPNVDNPYNNAHWWPTGFKYVLPFLEPTGR